MAKFKERNNAVLSPVLGRYHHIEFKSGKGCYLYDTEGKKYLDFASGIAVASTGHCHDTVVKAIKDQAETLIHPCIGLGYYEGPIRLAELLAEKIGSDYQSFFTQSGTEANEAAIKLAKYVTKRQKLLALKGGFHGRTLGALSVTTSKEKYRDGYEPLLPGISFLNYPYTYRCPWNTSSKEACIQAGVEEIEKSPLFNKDVAAIILEPMLGEGGYVFMEEAYLKAIEKRCKEEGILIIADEIQTGVARSGTWTYIEQLNVKPDIITLAKGLASGMPLGVCLARKELMSKWSPGAHGGTYGGNPVTTAAGIATLNVLSPLLPDIKELGETALNYLHQTLDQLSCVGEIRGKGLLIGIEIVKDKKSKDPDPEKMKQILEACKAKNLLLISCGLHDNVIRIIPPLIIDKKTLLEGLEIIQKVIHESN